MIASIAVLKPDRLADWEVSAAVFGVTLITLILARWWHTKRSPIFPEDIPTQARKTHEGAIPLVGVIPATVLIGGLIWIQEYWIASAAFVAAAIGFFDDRRKTDEPTDGFWKTKALALFGAAGLVTIGLAFNCTLVWWEYPIAFGIVFVVTNAFNFLDNQNGVLLGLIAVAGTFLAWLDPPAGFVVAGAALAVLPFNWPKGRVFVGDCGAYSLGLSVAALSLGHTPDRWWSDEKCTPYFAVVLVPLLDFTQVVIARLWIGIAPWIGDRRHLTHIVLHRGVPAALIGPIFWVVAAGLAYALYFEPR
ncbi:MAG: MraY family glycosyltransferase [Planctomycetota bacterium]